MKRHLLPLADVPKRANDGFYEFDKPCARYLYSNDPIVSPERAEAVQADVLERGTHFICHVASMADGKDVACATWAKRHGMSSAVRRLAKHYGLIVQVEQPKSEGSR